MRERRQPPARPPAEPKRVAILFPHEDPIPDLSGDRHASRRTGVDRADSSTDYAEQADLCAVAMDPAAVRRRPRRTCSTNDRGARTRGCSGSRAVRLFGMTESDHRDRSTWRQATRRAHVRHALGYPCTPSHTPPSPAHARRAARSPSQPRSRAPSSPRRGPPSYPRTPRSPPVPRRASRSTERSPTSACGSRRPARRRIATIAVERRRRGHRACRTVSMSASLTASVVYRRMLRGT